MRVFVIDWDPRGVITQADRLEVLGHHVVGTASMHQARPPQRGGLDAVVAWGHRDPERTSALLARGIHEGETAALPVLFVDAPERFRPVLEQHAAPAVFIDTAHLEEGLQELAKAVKRAEKAERHVRKDHPMPEHAAYPEQA